MTTEQQQQFDFQRSDQLGLIDEAHIDSQTVGKDRVRGTHIRHVLRVIDSHGRGREAYPSIETIARETSLSARTVKRAIAALVSLSLIIVTKRRPPAGPVPVNHYRIVWSELSLLVQRKRAMSEAEREAAWGQSGPMHGASESEHGASLSKHGASLSRAWGQTGPQTAKEAPGNSSPPDAPPIAQEEEKEVVSIPFQSTGPAPGALVLIRTETPRRSLVDQYQDEGVFTARQLVERALAQVGEQYLHDLLDYWRANRTSWRGTGALAERLRRSTPTLPIADGWPPRTPPAVPPPPRQSPEERKAARNQYEQDKAIARAIAAEDVPLAEQLKRLREAALEQRNG